MKRYIAAVTVAAALLISGAFAGQKKEEARIQKAVVQFTEPVKLLNVVLNGEYLFVHDEDKMAKGEACSYVYTRENGQQGKLVVSFHCQPVPREPSNQFTVTVTPGPNSDLLELVEYRFANSPEGHRVPPKA
jgi:hypothetical protein